MANNIQHNSSDKDGALHHAAANFGAMGHGQAGSQLSHLNHQRQPASSALVGHVQASQHQSSAGLGLQHDPDAIDLQKIASMLQNHQQRMEGLEKLQKALAKSPARKLLCEPHGSIPGSSQNLQNIFKGLRACLQVNENQSDALLSVNQILYDMMQDLPRSPNELMPEVTSLLPYFIENLGNSKATVRKSTHKCIGTFVKFSKRLEYVLQNIIKYGLENTNNQRTRQHSMLVIPALISLKSTVIQQPTNEMHQLILAVISRLRDPADSVAKTAKKLLLELQKCYPSVFKMNYIDSLPNEDERVICSFILDNKFEEATKLIMSTSPSKRMAQGNSAQAAGQQQQQPALLFNPQGEDVLSQQTPSSSMTGNTTNQGRNNFAGIGDQVVDRQNSHNFGAIGKAIVPTSQTNLPGGIGSPLNNMMARQESLVESNNSFIVNGNDQRQQRPLLQEQNSFGGQSQQQQVSTSSTTNVKFGDLSVVGREIVNSQVKVAKPVAPGRSQISDSQSARESSDGQQPKEKNKQKTQTSGGLPIDQSNGLVFGFLDEEIVEALNENNQWKDRTNAMEQIEAQLMQLIGTQSGKQKLTEQTATAFLGFIYQFVTDINFKISLAAIKIVTLLLQEDLINLKVYFTSLLSNLVEKLSDSKQVVRDMVMECCCSMINRSKPVPFAQQIIKHLQHANWHVREGVLILLVRSILVASQVAKGGANLKPNLPGDSGSAISQLSINPQLIEEVCFLVKVEDKKQLQQMGIDTLALLISKSPTKSKSEALVMKELGVQSSDANKQQINQFGAGTTKDNAIYAQIQQRIQAQALPFINNSDQVEFAPASQMVQHQQPTPSVTTPSSASGPPSALFLQHKQNEQALSEGGATQPISEIQQISNSLQQMQINSNLNNKQAGPSSKMQQNQPGLKQIQPGNQAYKTPSMAFLENKRREEEKQLQSQQQQQQSYPQSADFKKVTGPMSPVGAQNQGANGLPPNQQSSYSMRKLKQQDRNKPAAASVEADKIGMWLPSFSPMPEAASSQQPSAGTRKQDMLASPMMNADKDPRLHQMQMSQEFTHPTHVNVQHSPKGMPRSTKAPDLNGYNLNATASSNATFIDENRSNLTNKATALTNARTQPLYEQANKTQSSDLNQPSQHAQLQQRSGYIPEVHQQKPRSIQSNYDKQRAFNQSQGSNNSSNQSSTGPSQQTIAGTTQPTNNSNGFDKSQISDRLQLLKNTNKYKTKAGEGQPQMMMAGAQGDVLMIPGQHASGQQMPDQYSDAGSAMVTQQTMNYSAVPDDQQSASHAESMYNKRQGPIRAAHLTINQEPKSNQNVGSKKMSAGLPTHVQLKQRQSHQMQTVSSQSSQKPPTISQYSNFTGIGDARGANQTQYDETSRASSIDYTNGNNIGGPNRMLGDRPIRPAQNRTQGPQVMGVSQSEKKPGGHSKLAESDPRTLQNMLKQDSAQVYEIKDEPLTNPEAQLRPAIEALKSSDWSKTFEALNVIKRGVQFHKTLFTHPSPMTAQIFKDIVKAVDSLRSQVSKNACLCISTMFSELSPRDLDSHIETVMPTILKRSTDTNQFISSEAEKSFVAIINNCTETRVFAALQSLGLKSAIYKEKVCLMYTVLIERLAHRLKNFRDLERLVQTVVRFLSEGAVEVRSQAKYALLTMQSVCGTQRELDGIFLKSRLNENQMEKVRKVLASEDFESLSNYANTRYGASMRASPLGGARHTQYNAVGQSIPRHKANGSYGASGSDGFQKNNISNMQQTFLSSGAAQNHADRGRSSGPVGTSGIGNAVPPRGGVLSDHQITMQRGATSNHGSSSGFDNTQNTFNKRTTSVSKPVDRNLVEEMRNLVDSINTNDWQKRLKAIEQLEAFCKARGTPIRNAHASFINLMDAYCKLLNDNNTKVQTRAQLSFENILGLTDLGALVVSNLIMIVTALTQNLCATNAGVRTQGERLFDYVEEVVVQESRGNTNALLQPIVGCLSQPQNKIAKPHLVDRLGNLVERVDKQAIITRLLNPIVQPGHRLQQEANGNVPLKQALQRLTITLQSVQYGLDGMGIGLK